jgi:probable F420-dependent oxidoreductase
VKIGVMIFATDLTMPLHRLAPEVEMRGFESLWVTEKTHVPTSRRTPWPGGALPDWYKRTCDPLIALSAAAAVTSTLRLGTGVLLAGVRDPVICAKEIATLDWMSGGRFELGVGYGWNAEELATHGIGLDQSRAVLADKLGLMTSVWTSEAPSYRGPFVSMEPSWSWPKPVQIPRPPVHIGARASAGVFEDVAAYADGWMPIEGYGTVTRHIPRLREAFEAAGRRGSDAIVTVYSSGGAPETLCAYEEAGVDRVVIWLPPEEEQVVLRALDDHASRA